MAYVSDVIVDRVQQEAWHTLHCVASNTIHAWSGPCCWVSFQQAIQVTVTMQVTVNSPDLVAATTTTMLRILL